MTLHQANITFLSTRNPSLVANDVKQAVNTWFKSQAENFYDKGVRCPVSHYKNCFKNDEDYIETQFKVCSSNSNKNVL